MTVDVVAKLKPRSVGELLDQAIRLYRANFFKFVAVTAVVQVPMTLLNLVFVAITMSSSVMQLF